MVINKISLFFIVIALGVSFQTLAAMPERVEEIVAIVNDEPILKTTFLRKLQEAKTTVKRDETSVSENILQQQVLEQMILSAIERQMANELGIEVTDEMLSRAVEAIAKQNQMDVATFKSGLKQSGIDFDLFKEDLRQEIQLNELKRQKIGKQIQVSNQEIDNFLGTNRPAPDPVLVSQKHVRHILIKLSNTVTDTDVKLKLEKIRSQILSGKTFESVAKTFSMDSISANEGGDLKWVNPGFLPPEFEAAIQNLKVGEVSEPFKTEIGWHIAEVVETRQQDASEEMGRNQAKEELQKRKYLEELQNWLIDIRKQAYVDIRLKP